MYVQVCVPQHETVCCGISCVAKPDITFTAVPTTLHPFVIFLAPYTATSPLYSIVRIDLYRKESDGKGANHGRSSTKTTTATVVTDELGSQLQAKLLQTLLYPMAEMLM